MIRGKYTNCRDLPGPMDLGPAHPPEYYEQPEWRCTKCKQGVWDCDLIEEGEDRHQLSQCCNAEVEEPVWED